MLGYLDLGRDVADPTDDDAVFVCGARCAAEVFLGPHRIGRTALSPLDALTSLQVSIGGEVASTVRRYPDHVEKSHDLGGRVVAHSRWFAAVDDPVVIIWITVTNTGDDDRTVEVVAQADHNVNYVSKFRRYTNDDAEVVGERLIVHDRRYPALHTLTTSRPGWTMIDVGGGDGAVLSTSTHVITVAAGAAAELVIMVAGSDRPGAVEPVVDATLVDPAAAFATMIETWDRRLRSEVGLVSGHPLVDRLFTHSVLWAHKDARIVPLGPPYALGRADNAEVLALTASPDYHGLFANDAGQSAWELGALGPAFHPVLDHTLQVLLGFDVPESVEIDPIDATGTPWLSPLRIGQRPQWVMGAAALVLWTGRDAGRYWPQVQQVLARFADDDRDGDWLDDWSDSTFPEQPDPGAFHHEMLYANAFWYQAFTMGAELARFVDDHDRASDYVDTAARIATAVEERFGTGYGYASWLDAEHRQHPHQGHTMVLPLQYGMTSSERAAATFDTLLHGPIWSDDGPLAMEPAYPNLGGAHAWGFLRWNLVHALFRYGRSDRAGALLLRWAEQEERLNFPAPEGFPTVTGVTGQGYVWTAARAIRALLFGLCGLQLTAAGLVLDPHLPTGWGPVRLERLPFRGATFEIVIEHGAEHRLLLDDHPLPWGSPIDPGSGHHAIMITM